MKNKFFTRRSMKRLAAAVLTAGLAGTVLTGCKTSEATGGTASKEAASGKEAHIGIIFTEAGLGGNSFNDLALEGVKKAAEDYGITYDQVEPKSVSDEEIIQDEMAASGEYDLIICVGAEQVDALTNVATTYPEQKFALLDADSDLENVASYSCKEQEGSFLVGALAVLAKQEAADSKLGDGKTIGFIGGVDNPLINHFAAGYKAGAQYIDPEIQVLIDYAGGFNDPTTAKTIANTFVEKGADVIFHAAGASGMGMFQAAQETGFVAMGVNLNQNDIAPDYIMASMLKKLDSCAYHAITSIVEGTYNGENQVLGLSDGGVDFTVEKSNIQVSEDILGQLEDLKQKIIAGEIEVPSELK
ncbi:MAG: BMP family ABC transporter substrate-binding protein [Clostridium sp.]|nr:BMP family ABC transporter substrate-binding protein [Clostridium sp.]